MCQGPLPTLALHIYSVAILSLNINVQKTNLAALVQPDCAEFYKAI